MGNENAGSANLEVLLQKSAGYYKRMNLGDVHFNNGRFVAALTNYEKAISIIPEQADAYDSMIDTLRTMKCLPDFQDAETQQKVDAKIRLVIENGIVNGVYDELALKLHDAEKAA